MKEELKASMKEAMKAKDKPRLQTIRSILSAFQYEEMQKGVDELDEKGCIAILQSELKKRKESLEFAEKDGRQDLIDEANAEIAVIESFLPKQLSNEELEKLVVTLKEENPDANMGVIMKSLKEKYAGQYDGRAASELVKKVLA